MNYFDWISSDWVGVFAEHINKNLIIKLDDNRYKATKSASITVPWLFVNMVSSLTAKEKCYQYHEFYLRKLGVIPLICHECYKVVVEPRTVKELFELHELQKKLMIPSKCGIEERAYVPRLYGGYFYTKGLKSGRECYELVRKRVSERIAIAIPVSLKKGCTEFEAQFGPSDKWQILKDQDKLEAEFDKRYFEENSDSIEQDTDLVSHIKIKWCQFAATAKPPDLTYKEFTGGKSLVQEVKYITYHDNGKQEKT